MMGSVFEDIANAARIAEFLFWSLIFVGSLLIIFGLTYLFIYVWEWRVSRRESEVIDIRSDIEV